MSRNGRELAVSRERLAKIEQTLEALEIERIQGEILDYLVQNAPRKEGAPA